jgi:hypothetical protein
MASGGIVMNVEGLEKALAKLEELKKIDRSKARDFKRSLRKSAKPLVTAMKTRIKNSNRSSVKIGKVTTNFSTGKSKDVTYKSGNLRRSIAFIPSKTPGLIGYVGARFGKRAGKTYDGYYAAIVNYGTKRGGAKGLAVASGRSGRFGKTSQLKDRRNVDFALDAYKQAGKQVEKALQKEVNFILKKTLNQLSRK